MNVLMTIVPGANSTSTSKKTKKWANSSFTKGGGGRGSGPITSANYSSSVSPAMYTRSLNGQAENAQRSKFLKDEKRMNFATFIDNLPNIKSKVKRGDPVTV